MAECVKTGSHIWLEQYDEWVYGDAFLKDGSLFINACYRSSEPARPVKHFTIQVVDHWWNEQRTSMLYETVLCSKPGAFIDHGYDGVPIYG